MKALLFLLIITNIIVGQAELDKILNKIENLPDTTRINRLSDFCWTYRNQNPQQALEGGKLALKIAEENNLFGFAAKAANLIGVVYRNMGDYDTAVKYYKRAFDYAEKEKDSLQIAYSYNNIGGIFRIEGNNPLALSYILKAMKIFENLGDKKGLAFCTINIGLIYRRQENYRRALEYLYQTIKLREEIEDRPGRALALDWIAQINKDQKNIDEALKYYLEAEKEYKAINDKKGMASVWGGLADIYYQKNEKRKAFEYRMSALKTSAEIDYLEGEATNSAHIGFLYAEKGNFRNAKLYFDRALNIAESMREISVQIECYRLMVKYKELEGKFEEALEYSKRYSVLRDSVVNTEKVTLAAELEVSHLIEKAEREKLILQKDVEIAQEQRNFIIIITILVMIIAIVTYSRYREHKKAEMHLKNLNEMKDKLFSIIAHDLKNPFGVILGATEVIINEIDSLEKVELKEYINSIDTVGKQTYRLLENLLYWAGSQSGRVTFQPVELDLKKLIEEVLTNMSDLARNKSIAISFQIKTDDTLIADPEMIKTILRNLISNGIKFTPRGGNVSITVMGEGKEKIIKVKDTGIGIEDSLKEKLFTIDSITSTPGTDGEKGTGLGLMICKEFIEKHGGTISIESEPGKGTEFIISFPLKKE